MARLGAGRLYLLRAAYGTYTTEGTFDAIIPRIADLKSLGVSAIELMPVAQFPGGRNWGYDGVFPFAVQSTYGGPEGLKRLVNACHCEGLAVVLDVVYNHLGPEGNYLGDFGPYFTDRYQTPGARLSTSTAPRVITLFASSLKMQSIGWTISILIACGLTPSTESWIAMLSLFSHC